MKIGIPRETRDGETRVAATPESVKKLVQAGHTVLVEHGAGFAAQFLDEQYQDSGATLVTASEALDAELVLKVRAPDQIELAQMSAGTVLVGMLEPYDAVSMERLAAAGLTAFALESAPRISRAQSMDVLSSQANLAGYKAVILGANAFGKIFPMMMTAAGTVKAARVVVLGAGVAGLQAIATAKRLGAVVEASDVRPAAREQVESLGAKFIDVPFETELERQAAQGVGGYAQPMPPSWMARQAEKVAERCSQADIVICTALIPGRPAPQLVSVDTVKAMKPGSVIVDMAVERGGNCPLSQLGLTVVEHGVTIIGLPNLPGLLATDASALYARNLLEFLKLILARPDDKTAKAEANGTANTNADTGAEKSVNTTAPGLAINRDDEIVQACLVCEDGQLLKKA